MAQQPKKQWFRAKYQRKKPGSSTSSTGAKSFFVFTHQEAIDTLLFEQRTAYPDHDVLVTAG
ncbi:hypothetical protein [Pseudomonas orientalis]|uniref:hypothetical protein n=1 Tax=Pseudomonas orientalis TaxID=76758 RepID=UPI002FE34A90